MQMYANRWRCRQISSDTDTGTRQTLSELSQLATLWPVWNLVSFCRRGFPNNGSSLPPGPDIQLARKIYATPFRSDSRVDSADEVPKLILLIRESYEHDGFFLYLRSPPHGTWMTTRSSGEKLAVAETKNQNLMLKIYVFLLCVFRWTLECEKRANFGQTESLKSGRWPFKNN